MIQSDSSHPQLSPPRTFFCCWDWCRLTFSTVDELASHVRHDHIWELQPMSKKEIVRMRKKEAAEAQSMTESSGSSVPVHLSNGGLHSYSTDQGLLGFQPFTSSAPPSGILSPTSLMPPNSRQSTSFPPPNKISPLPAPARASDFPSFAQLSSPADTSSVASLPRSPDLSTLLFRPNLAAQIDSFDRRHSRLSEIAQTHANMSLQHSRTDSSSSSQDAVERQLIREDAADVSIQSIQMQVPETVHNGAAEGAASSISEDPAAIVASTVVDIADADLQWPESDPEHTPASQPRPLSPPAKSEDVECIESPVVTQNDRGRHFRSGTLHISPLPKGTAPKTAFGRSQSSQDSQMTSNSSLSQDSAQSSSLVLQTQAPYQSQSYELSQS